MNIWDLLPTYIWEGLPLPRFMNVFWPWVQASSQSASQSTLAGLFNNSPAANNAAKNNNPAPAYENLEEISFPEGFDPDTLMPKKIVVHRKYKKRVD